MRYQATLFFLCNVVSLCLYAHPVVLPKKPNILVILTDQERHPMHWPLDWVEKNLPSYELLKKHGLSFEKAYTAACMCSPSRAAFMTSQFSPINKVSKTLSSPSTPTLPAKNSLENLASWLQKKTDYEVVWKGKWQLSFAANGFENWSKRDIPFMRQKYGPLYWTPPDAGNADHSSYKKDPRFALSTLGGGFANNDARILQGHSKIDPRQTPGWGESILEYLESVGKTPSEKRKPFCLFVSLINPHDVWVYPEAFKNSGYSLKEFDTLNINLPHNFRDSLVSKPSIQQKLRRALNEISPLTSKDSEENYAKFYAYLHKVVDRQISSILSSLEKHNLLEDTIIIRTSDHGEMGLSHGLREKAYTAYEEAIHIPLIISNPKMFPVPKKTDAFYSHLDLVPTIAELIGTAPEKNLFKGISQVPVILEAKPSVRDSITFAYDDVCLLSEKEPASHIRAIRKDQWTYAVYFDPYGTKFEYELYDLEADPGQLNNLLFGFLRERFFPIASKLHEELTNNLKKEEGLLPHSSWPENPFTLSPKKQESFEKTN